MIVTFSDSFENPKNTIIGNKAINGMRNDELCKLKEKFGGELHNLALGSTEGPIYVWVVPLLNREDAVNLAKSLESLPWDTQELSRGKIVNKRTKSLFFADSARAPDISAGINRIAEFGDLAAIRQKLGELSPRLTNLVAAANTKNATPGGLITAGLNLGSPRTLNFSSHFVGVKTDIEPIPLNTGELYILSDRANGASGDHRMPFVFKYKIV